MTSPCYDHAGVILYNAHNMDVLAGVESESIDAVVTDPPYGLEFMGKAWDYQIPDVPTFAELLRVLKPGGHLLCFGGTRTFHRIWVNIEDAGFEIRDCLTWMYGTGFPKSLDVSKAIDKAAGATREVLGISGKSGSKRSCMSGDFTGGEYMATAPATTEARQWDGWGTSLKPSYEPVLWAKKPLRIVPLGVIKDTGLLIGGLICLSISSVKHAEKLFQSSPKGSGGDPYVFAQWIADVYHGTLSVKPFEKMDMFKSPGAAKIISNIVKLWNFILAVNFDRGNKFTIETTTGLTIALKTLNSLILPTIQDYITQDGMNLLGLKLNVCIAGENSNDLKVNCKKGIFVRENVLSLLEQRCVNIAEKLFMHVAQAVNTVLFDAIKILGKTENLSPNFEPICLARKPFPGTVANNVLEHGTGALNIDGARIATDDNLDGGAYSKHGTDRHDGWGFKRTGEAGQYAQPTGRWPANVILDEDAAAMLDEQSGERPTGEVKPYSENHRNRTSYGFDRKKTFSKPSDTGGASRFFYIAKADKGDRGKDNTHTTVKPTKLMKYLVRLVTPPGGVVLDPFMGSGSTIFAARDLGFKAVGIELEKEYCEIAVKRLRQGVLDFGGGS